uniref:Separase n=1 Tax=Graphocephala atropunctata TaxID=36148 RepID=A0A1B6LD07_9HEMI
MAKEETDFYPRWIKLLKSGYFQEVKKEVAVKEINGKQALGCIVALAQLAYDATKGNGQISSPCDVVSLTQKFATNVKPDKSNTLRYLTSLYHITNFLCEKDHFEQVTVLLNTVVEFKDENLELYTMEGKTLHDHFVAIFVKAVKKLVSRDNTADNTAVAATVSMLTTMWKLLLVNKTMRNGTVFLQNTIQACQILGQQDQKVAVRVITASLKLISEVDTIEDLEACLPQLFNLYSCLYRIQFKVTGHFSALSAVRSHLDQVKWKWSQKKVHAECFMVLCNATILFMWDYQEPSFTNKVQDNISVLTSFRGLSKNASVNAACALMEVMLMNSNRSMRKDVPVMPQSCLKPFLRMLLLLHGVFSDSETESMDHIKCLLDVFLFVINKEEAQCDSKQLKECVEFFLLARSDLVKAINNMISTNHSKAEKSIGLALNCFANILRVYKTAKLPEEIIILAKSFCQFICSLSSEVLKNSQNQYTVEVMFTILVSALGTERLDGALEALMAWLLKCPHESKKIFKLWGNLKHNSVCECNTEYLNITVQTIFERKNLFEQNWLQCQLSSNEIGKLLVEELETYCQNTHLRGEPVIAAADTLLALSTDYITQVKGLIVAMEVTSATENFADQCLRYYSKSKNLIKLLRKEKKQIDSVQFNFCMGNLLYVQLLCEIRHLRKECESEMVRLSVGPADPLVSELPESRPDPNDTCDVATKYNSLCLAEHRKVVESVDSAMRHWGFAYSVLKEQRKEEYDLSMTLEMLQGAGLLLRLYCDKVRQEKIWKLLHDLATMTGDVNMVVVAVGEMLNVTEVSQDLIENTKISLQQSEVSRKVGDLFHLNLALHYLTHDKVEDGLKLLSDIECKEKSHTIVYTYLLLVVGMYQQNSDWKTYNHKFHSLPSYHLSFHRAVSCLLFLVEEKKWGSLKEASHIHYQILRVSQLLGEAYCFLEQPREARCYLKSFLGLAQKLALPLGTVQLLLLLAWVDLSTGKVDDCAVKIEGLEDLLELCGTPLVYQQAPGSPSCLPARRGVLSPPEYLDHPPSCPCLPCSTEEYRRLVLETVTLRATFCAIFGQLSEGLQCFDVAIRVEEDLSRSGNKDVLKSCVRMWMRYGDVLASTSKYRDSSAANEKALKLLSTVKDPILLQHLVEQKICPQFLEQPLLFQPISARISTEIKNTPSKSQIPQPMTPKNTLPPGKSPLAVVNDNITPITPFARPVKPFKLPSSGDENTPPISVPKSRRKLKQLPKFITETPQPIHAISGTKASRTPFVIVDDDGKAVGISGKKTRPKTIQKIQTEVVNKAVEAPKKKLFNSVTESSHLKSEFAIPLDSEDCIVRKSNCKIGLKTYGKSKVPCKVGSKLVSLSGNKSTYSREDQNVNGGAFHFNEMTNAIESLKDSIVTDFVEGTPPKKFTPTRLPQPARSSKFCGQVLLSQTENSKNRSLSAISKKAKEAKDDSDCDIVEGTPPESLVRHTRSLNIKRSTRSKK